MGLLVLSTYAATDQHERIHRGIPAEGA